MQCNVKTIPQSKVLVLYLFLHKLEIKFGESGCKLMQQFTVNAQNVCVMCLQSLSTGYVVILMFMQTKRAQSCRFYL